MWLAIADIAANRDGLRQTDAGHRLGCQSLRKLRTAVYGAELPALIGTQGERTAEADFGRHR